MRKRFLKFLHRCAPFDIRGDCEVSRPSGNICISCLINFYGRLDLLSGILHSLAQQDFPKEEFEIILVEDRGGTDEGRKMADGFSDRLQIRYYPLDKNFGMLGYSRNYALSHSRGEIILFLDDDTVILQRDFLGILRDLLATNPLIDAIVPHGHASFAEINSRYDYHDPYFMTSRCMAYRRSVLAELSGFVDEFTGQEDVEFVVRFHMAAKRALNVQELEYYHPPLIVGNLRKPMAVGQSFFRVRKRYPLTIWLLLLMNCSRHAPLCLIPLRRFREMGRFGLGFILGVISGMRNKKGVHYG